MCGIAGAFSKRPISESKVRKTIFHLQQRGPDSNGFLKRRAKDGSYVTLIHTRLSILDLDKRSSQPMSSEKSDLIFNGEIYNYLELKKYLKDLNLITSSDTEILINLLEHENLNTFNLIEGMWSFAWFNKENSKLILSRDRFGQKPLLYYVDDFGNLFFASNIKALQTISGINFKINKEKVSEFINFGYKFVSKDNKSFFEKVSYLPSGTFATFDDSNWIKIKSFWNKHEEIEHDMTYHDAVAGTRELLIKSVERCLRADVPIAFCLSAGIDSNALISIAKKVCGYNVHGYTVMNKNKNYEERELVESTVEFLKIKHSILNVGEGNLLEDLKNAVKGYSGPILTSNYLEHWKLLRLIKKDGYKVSVSGTGADELFSGYYDHYLYFLADLCLSGDFVNFEKEKKLWQNKILPFTRNEALKSVSGFLLNLNKRDYIFDNKILVNKYLKESSSKKIFDYMYCGGNLRNRMANELFHESVPPILYMDDSNSMYSSIENRSPFLDFDLYKWSLKIPSKFLIRSGLAKSILRDAVSEIADPKVCNNPRKVGFNVPIDDLIKNDKTKIIKDIKASQISEIINLVQFESLLNKNSKTNQESKFIFSILSLFAFLNEYST